jgi:hypothetical protein
MEQMGNQFSGKIMKGDLVAYANVKVVFFGQNSDHNWNALVTVLSWEPAAPDPLDKFRLILEDRREFPSVVITSDLQESKKPIQFTLAGYSETPNI